MEYCRSGDPRREFLVVGCGLSGVTIAERLTNVLKADVTIIDKRDHIGGNCYDYIEPETNILVHKYGPHLFHTNNERVWEYVNRFDKWVRWEHKVLSFVDGRYVTVPVNISTVNDLCGTNIQTTEDMVQWLQNNQVKYDNITNSEEMAKSRIGNVLYDKLIRDYTFKQWNRYPEELDPSVCGRIPIRDNFDPRYFTDKYQALPHKGYTHFIRSILNNINVILNTTYDDYVKTHDMTNVTVIFTGPIDEYFSSRGLDRLEYRSIKFTQTIYKNIKYFQPTSQVNYPSLEYPFTRIVEYKHLLNQQSDHSVVVSEQSSDVGDPYYPVPNERNLSLYNQYKLMSEEEEKKGVYFLGRLANYKYFNMDQAIDNALSFFDTKFNYSQLQSLQ